MAISSRYTRGIEIQIGGNATKLKTALDSANRSIRTTQSELDTLKNSLKLEWDATKFQRAQALAQKALSETEAKVELLRRLWLPWVTLPPSAPLRKSSMRPCAGN